MFLKPFKAFYLQLISGKWEEIQPKISYCHTIVQSLASRNSNDPSYRRQLLVWNELSGQMHKTHQLLIANYPHSIFFLDLPYSNSFKTLKAICPNLVWWPSASDVPMLLWTCCLSAVHYFAYPVDLAFGWQPQFYKWL